MSTDLTHIKLGGPVMGTRWSADLGVPNGTDIAGLEAALALALAQVDAQMSTWKPESDLMRLHAAPVGHWVDVPTELMEVLKRGLDIGQASDGAFDIGLGDLVVAWGFNAADPDVDAIRANLGRNRQPAQDTLELDEVALRARKRAPMAIDLSGIAKGYGVDRMMQVCEDHEIPSALVGLDGELRCKGRQADGLPWTVAIEKPDYDNRLPLSLLELQDAAIATSGDYRHWVDVGNARLSHTMDRQRGGPVEPGIAGVTIVADDCMTADAMATAVQVLGMERGSGFALRMGLNCLILERTKVGIRQHGIGPLFQRRVDAG